MLLDPLGDALSVIRNAESVGKQSCIIRPASKMIGNVLKVMKDDGYIKEFEFVDDGKSGMFKVVLKGRINTCGIIRPRYAVDISQFEKWEMRYLPSRNFGSLILTTSAGVMSHSEARKKGVGGMLLAFVY